MNPLVIVGVVAALAVCGIGIQLLSGALRTTPVDAHPAGWLFERPPAAETVAPPPSLSIVEQLVEDSLYSDVVARERLWPMIVTLGRARRVDPALLRPPDGDTRAWLAEMMDVLDGARSDQPSS